MQIWVEAMKTTPRTQVFALVLIGLSLGASAACKKSSSATLAPASTAAGAAAAAEASQTGICRVTESDMCVVLKGKSRKDNVDQCDAFSGTFSTSGTCEKELRLGSCDIAKDKLTAVYYAGDKNDVHDSREHCEKKLRGKFSMEPVSALTAQFTPTALTNTLAGLSLNAPAQVKQEMAGSALNLVRYEGYFDLLLTKEKWDLKSETADAKDEKFVEMLTSTADLLVWKSKRASGEMGMSFATHVLVDKVDYTCKSGTDLDARELIDANIAACKTLAKAAK
jgi:hypothetical protein